MSSAQPSPVPQGQYQPPARMPEYGDQSQVDRQYKGMTPGDALGGGLTMSGGGSLVARNQDPFLGGVSPHVVDTATEERLRREFEEFQQRQSSPGLPPGVSIGQPVDTPRVSDPQDGMTPGERFGGGLALPGQQPPLTIEDLIRQDPNKFISNGMDALRLPPGLPPGVSIGQPVDRNPVNPTPFLGFPGPGYAPQPTTMPALAPDDMARQNQGPPVDFLTAIGQPMPTTLPATGGPGLPMINPYQPRDPGNLVDRGRIELPAPQPTQPIRPNRIQNRLRVGQPQGRPAPAPQPTRPIAPRRNRFRLRGF